MNSDEQLYQCFLDGNEEALDELLMRYSDRLTLFLRKYTATDEDAQDLMMDSFAQLLAKKPKFKGNSSFKTWLYSIGRNLALNHIRKTRHFLFVDYDEVQIEDSSANPEYNTLQSEVSEIVRLTLDKLPERYRTVLYLQYYDDLSVVETAAAMNCSQKQIYNLTARAKKQLKELLSEAGIEDFEMR